ncbi:MAG: hypothetical protein ACOY3I_02320 [Verrucomicrobiota bacterium]
MKNLDDFEKELAKLDRTDSGALKSLRDQLRAMSEDALPGDQHQRWAWTRFEAHIRGWNISAGKWWGIRAVGWSMVTLMAVWIGVATWNLPLRDLPIVTAVNFGVSAVPFYARETGVDVIWVDGYEYMPESYVIQ